jgi:hypothetical protein
MTELPVRAPVLLHWTEVHFGRIYRRSMEQTRAAAELLQL